MVDLAAALLSIAKMLSTLDILSTQRQALINKARIGREAIANRLLTSNPSTCNLSKLAQECLMPVFRLETDRRIPRDCLFHLDLRLVVQALL
jgi:hypothetical protein